MGRVRSKFVKSSAQKIYEKGSENFNTNFTENKKIVDEYASFNSKRLKNVVVGYITKLKKGDSQNV